MSNTRPLPALRTQKSRYNLPKELHFLNCATFSPASKRVQKAGIEAVKRIASPHWLKPLDFFEPAERLRQSLAQVVHAPDPLRIALMPATSYGMAVVAANLHRKPGLRRGQEILIFGDEFPNHRYALERVAAQLGLTIVQVDRPASIQVGRQWNQAIMERIGPNTCLVVGAHVHWIYGTVFNLEAIGARCREVGALLVVDGTQSVGVLPFDVRTIQPDALLVGCYKWMMGPYSTGFGYLGAFFDDGIPVEETWMNRERSHEFHNLLAYQPNYRPLAQRYNGGEFSNFTSLPMLQAAVDELLDNRPERIQQYCAGLLSPVLPEMEAMGYVFEEEAFRAAHLFGIQLPQGRSTDALLAALQREQVVVAVRGTTVRVSPYLYNGPDDMAALVRACGAV